MGRKTLIPTMPGRQPVMQRTNAPAPQAQVQAQPGAGGAAQVMPPVQSMKKGGQVKARGCGCAVKGLTKGKMR